MYEKILTINVFFFYFYEWIDTTCTSLSVRKSFPVKRLNAIILNNIVTINLIARKKIVNYTYIRSYFSSILLDSSRKRVLFSFSYNDTRFIYFQTDFRVEVEELG